MYPLLLHHRFVSLMPVPIQGSAAVNKLCQHGDQDRHRGAFYITFPRVWQSDGQEFAVTHRLRRLCLDLSDDFRFRRGKERRTDLLAVKRGQNCSGNYITIPLATPLSYHDCGRKVADNKQTCMLCGLSAALYWIFLRPVCSRTHATRGSLL